MFVDWVGRWYMERKKRENQETAAFERWLRDWNSQGPNSSEVYRIIDRLVLVRTLVGRRRMWRLLKSGKLV